MAGLYIHIPFCQQACHYCNFYFVTSTSRMPAFIQSLQLEIQQKKETIADSISSIYFGGGTPSKVSTKDLAAILNTIHACFKVDNNAEINIEVNPEDINFQYASDLKKLGFNRISIGIQSLIESELKMMNRAHNRTQAMDALDILQQIQFPKLSADLIYGLPHATAWQLQENIQIIHDHGIQHLSCYSLTVEEKTKLKRLIDKGSIEMLPENSNILHYETLIMETDKLGYEQYEISNFAQDEQYAIHNSSYWFGSEYLGFGPGAHSYHHGSRSWNVSNLNQYLNGVQNNEPYQETEVLTAENKTNEYIMTALRTKWGINRGHLNTHLEFPNNAVIDSLMEENYLTAIPNGNLVLTHEGKLIADHVIMQLMV